MKKVAVLATLAAGLGAFAAPAIAQTGTVGINYAQADAGGGDTDAWGINGGVAIPTGGNLVVLLDGGYSTNEDADVDAFTGTAHLISRNETSAIGGYVGFTSVESGGGDAEGLGIGGEYARFFETGTLAVSAGYATDDDNDVDVYGLSGEYRIFASDNLRFDIGASWANVDNGFGDDDGTAIGVGVEYRFGGAPVSIGANYQTVDAGGGDVDVIGATLRFDFGHSSLKDRDRNGNTFGAFGGLGAFLQ